MASQGFPRRGVPIGGRSDVWAAKRCDFALQWESGSIAESSWAIPKGAKLGSYRSSSWGSELRSRQRARSRMDLRGVSGRGVFGASDASHHSIPAEPQISVSELPVQIAVTYLAGGGASRLPVTLRAQIRPKIVSFPEDFEGFPSRMGLSRRAWSAAAPAARLVVARMGMSLRRRTVRGRDKVHQRLDLVLDEAGTARATIMRLPQLDEPVELLLELEYRDPNGEVQTVATTLPLWPTKWLVGVKTEHWVVSRTSLPPVW